MVAPPDTAAVLAAMTLAEKVALCAGRDFWTTYGVPRLGVPSIMLCDGPHGVRKPTDPHDIVPAANANAPATCFPTASALAATWDPGLVEEAGGALGREARAAGVSVLLGPGANIKRTPLCGRNFEYFSEDPMLSGRLAAAWIRGVQSTGVAASLKHLAANNQEHRRYTIDTLVDERTLREIYLASFERAVVEAGPWTVMAAYNRLDGVFCSEHRGLLTGILRDEWAFDGVVVSDWGAVNDRVAGLAAGLDLEMPGFGGHRDATIRGALHDGRLPVEALDRTVTRILTLVARTAGARDPDHAYDPVAHHDLARRVAAEGTVLLKNDGGLLPLAPGGRLGVVGAFARQPRYQGAGSSVVTAHRVDDAYHALEALAGGADRVSYAPGYHSGSGTIDGALLDEALLDEALLDEARAVARDVDVVIVFAGLTESYETEGLDRTHLCLPASHDAVIAAVAEVNPAVVVVLSNGAPVEMPWHDRVSAIVEGYLGGQAGGSAIARVLFGVAEPGGRLAETFPVRWPDNPVHALPNGPRQVEYRESVYVGYRYYDTARVRVRFPFGHGLSYTTFAYTDLTVAPATLPGTDDLRVSVTVTNTGGRSGIEVVQVYVHDVESTVFRPEQELRAFAKVRLRPGESTRVGFALDRRAFAYYDVDAAGWTVEPGDFEVRVGASSRDIRAAATVTVTTTDRTAPPRPGPDRYHDLTTAVGFDRAGFAAIYDRAVPDNTPDERGRFTLNTPISDMRASLAARVLLAVMRRRARSVTGAEDPNGPTARLVRGALDQMSLRMLTMASRGAVTVAVLDGLLQVFNGRYATGLRALLRATRVRQAKRRRWTRAR